MKAKIERILDEFLEYCESRYDNQTVRHYRMNICRLRDYIEQRKTRCKEYHDKYYRENKKSLEERDSSWMKDYRKIQYAEEIDRDFITKYVSYVNHDEISKNTYLPLNQSEKESRLYPLKTFLRYCERKGYLMKDLRRFVHIPAREKKILKRALTVDEMKRLLDVPDTTNSVGIRNRVILELSYSGLRVDEVLSTKLEHVDLVSNSLTIICGKGKKDRVVPMTSEAIYWVKRWLNRRKDFIGTNDDLSYLLITQGGRPIMRRNLAHFIKKWAKKAAIPIDISPHDLRRDTATHLAENGAPIRQLQALLGHATLRITAKYIRLSDEKIKHEHKKTHPSNRRKLHYGTI